MTQMTEAQKEVLANIARRLRRQAAQLDRLARAGDVDRLEKLCGTLHATGTQLEWMKGGMSGKKTS